MISQYNQFKGEKVESFIPIKYKTVLVDDYTRHNNKIFFQFSPPLFSQDKTSFIFYVVTIFDVKGSPTWESLYFVFQRKENKWKCIGKFKRKQDLKY